MMQKSYLFLEPRSLLVHKVRVPLFDNTQFRMAVKNLIASSRGVTQVMLSKNTIIIVGIFFAK